MCVGMLVVLTVYTSLFAVCFAWTWCPAFTLVAELLSLFCTLFHCSVFLLRRSQDHLVCANAGSNNSQKYTDVECNLHRSRKIVFLFHSCLCKIVIAVVLQLLSLFCVTFGIVCDAV